MHLVGAGPGLSWYGEPLRGNQAAHNTILCGGMYNARKEMGCVCAFNEHRRKDCKHVNKSEFVQETY